jgi:hypothetical protein
MQVISTMVIDGMKVNFGDGGKEGEKDEELRSLMFTQKKKKFQIKPSPTYFGGNGGEVESSGTKRKQAKGGLTRQVGRQVGREGS